MSGNLVLKRRVRESIMIGDDVEVIVVKVKGETVSLAIMAPAAIRVDRREIWEQKHHGDDTLSGGNNG
jgi:carbon storage regulator